MKVSIRKTIGAMIAIMVFYFIAGAVVISSILFGITHLMNLLGGADLATTLLQICFAFLYGIVLSLLFILGNSIWPCILLHGLHDFCSFIGASLNASWTLGLEISQTLILIIYIIMLAKRAKRK